VETTGDLAICVGDMPAPSGPHVRYGTAPCDDGTPTCLGTASDPLGLQRLLNGLEPRVRTPVESTPWDVLRPALDRTSEAIVLADAESRILRMTQCAATLLAEHAAANGSPTLHARLVELLPPLAELLVTARASERGANGEPAASTRRVFELARRGGGRRWIEVTVHPLALPDGGDGLCVQLRDVDARTRAERQALREATHDSLTGLPNRSYFVDRLAEALETQTPLAVLHLDIDRFKVVNDALGPSSGDSLLVAFADRILACCQPGQVVARLGADEFAVLMPNMRPAGALPHAERIRASAREPFDAWGREVFVSVSGGLATTDPHPGVATAHGLLRDANFALHEAKSEGGDRIAVWDAELHAQARSRVQLLADLRGAIARRAFHMHYQPLVELTTGRIRGFEALLRWRHPGRGNVPPGEFIPLAEQTGLIVPLSRYVLEMACCQVRAWLDATPGDGAGHPMDGVGVAVNASARHFALPTFVDDVVHALRVADLPPHHLEIEITESAAMQDASRAAGVVQRLRDIGVRVSIDDFGTGYSSLAYLHRLPVDVLKIDRSLVNAGEERDWLVVKSIVSLARHFGIDVVAEGVETAEQRQRLIDLGCTLGQGWLFARPLSPDDAAAAVLRRHCALPGCE
jgi:diguanylate cyclase (GGDEF)-like protein